MQDGHVEAIAEEWLRRTGDEPPALRAFLAESVPEVDDWAMRRAGVEPQILAVTKDRLYRIEGRVEDGRRGFGLELLPLTGMAVALAEWRDESTILRRWKLRTSDEGFTVETEQPPAREPPALERVMRLVLQRVR